MGRMKCDLPLLAPFKGRAGIAVIITADNSNNAAGVEIAIGLHIQQGDIVGGSHR